MVVGAIEFPAFGATVRADLDPDDGWVCPDELAQRHLTLMFPVTDIAPAHGAPGVLLLRQAAAGMGGSVVAESPPPSADGAIY
jgi:hypothetical protein